METPKTKKCPKCPREMVRHNAQYSCLCGWTECIPEGKYENINPLQKLHKGEPYFFLRAQDKLAPLAVIAYAHHLHVAGDDKGFRECMDFAQRMEHWQEANPDKVKMPD